MDSPVIGAPELVEAQAIPATTVNEQMRRLEQGARSFTFLDRDLTAPPASPADGDCYLVAASPTGAWAGKGGQIAFRMSTAWEFIAPRPGFRAYVHDEGIHIAFNGLSWSEIGGESGDPHIVLPNQVAYDALTRDANTFYFVPEA